MTPQPNEPTADTRVRLVTVEEKRIAELSATVRALRAENDRLLVERGELITEDGRIHTLLNDSGLSDYTDQNGVIGISDRVASVVQIVTQLRASLSTAVDALEGDILAFSDCANTFKGRNMFASYDVVKVYEQDIRTALAQLRPLLAGQPPSAEVKAEGKQITTKMYAEAEHLLLNEIMGASPLSLYAEPDQCDPEYGSAIEVTITHKSLSTSAQAGKGGAKP